MPAVELVADPARALAPLGNPDAVFVRPDSPLKPFSGRVLGRDAISLHALDHGFYYDDATLPVVVAPVRKVGREWRYVIVNGRVVAGSTYDAERRAALPDVPAGAPWRFTADVASRLPPPQCVYVLDVCEADGDLQLLELNPFSGADLFASDRTEVVAAVTRLAIAMYSTENTPSLNSGRRKFGSRDREAARASDDRACRRSARASDDPVRRDARRAFGRNHRAVVPVQRRERGPTEFSLVRVRRFSRTRIDRVRKGTRTWR